MLTSPRLRRLSLLVHVTCSLGWLGAVGAFLGLALIGMTHDDPATVRGVYLVMEPAAGVVLLPIAVASLVTGLVEALGSTWGLFRHSWVVAKLLLNSLALAILVIYMGTFRAMALVAADPSAHLAAIRNPSPAVHAALAMFVLLIATTLGVYKPVRSRWITAAGTAVVVMLVMVAAHLTGHVPHH